MIVLCALDSNFRHGLGCGFAEPHAQAANPGVCWAVRRDFFERVGGFPWQEVFSGANDLCWAFELTGEPAERFTGGIGAYARTIGLAPRWRGHCAVGTIALPLYHLWHKRWCDRAFLERQALLATSDFRPERDLRLTPDGTIELTDDGKRLAPVLAVLQRKVLEPDVLLSPDEVHAIVERWR